MCVDACFIWTGYGIISELPVWWNTAPHTHLTTSRCERRLTRRFAPSSVRSLDVFNVSCVKTQACISVWCAWCAVRCFVTPLNYVRYQTPSSVQRTPVHLRGLSKICQDAGTIAQSTIVTVTVAGHCWDTRFDARMLLQTPGHVNLLVDTRKNEMARWC